MKIKRLTLKNFTAFEDATFEFAPGVNTLIGENGTGKSHVLKVLYAVQEELHRHTKAHQQKLPGLTVHDDIADALSEVFMPDSANNGHLVRRGRGGEQAAIHVELERGVELDATISPVDGDVGVVARGAAAVLSSPIFVPPRELISIFPGFISSYQKRESSFDRTYYDLCVALDARPLRAPLDEGLLAPLEAALGGPVVFRDGKFRVRLPDGDMEAPLLAEGLRKLAMIAYLIVNGSLARGGTLFWDEPEANLNPRLAKLTAEVMAELAKRDVQVFTATHDYVLASELSLRSENDEVARTSNAFFGLQRTDKGVAVERKEFFGELDPNPILDAMASLHQREIEVDRGRKK